MTPPRKEAMLRWAEPVERRKGLPRHLWARHHRRQASAPPALLWADRCSTLVFAAMCVLPITFAHSLAVDPGLFVLSGFARILSSGIGLPGAVSVSARAAAPPAVMIDKAAMTRSEDTNTPHHVLPCFAGLVQRALGTGRRDFTVTQMRILSHKARTKIGRLNHPPNVIGSNQRKRGRTLARGQPVRYCAALLA